ncbi:MAG: alcohol dehydrogenase catalytic domain-containing protein [Nitrospiraceae bacterium]|nr:alcohol dehydrogenase catalytic domain-containing protein [Nitrospiraceae bacterium]
MKQLWLAAPGRIDLREVPLPSPGNGELLLKIKASLTCGTDLKAYLRGHNLIPMPGPFGHEFSGVVAKAGKGVKKFREGDEVMAVHTAPCLKCPYCKKGLYNLCMNIMDSKVLGAFGQYILLPRRIVLLNTFKKPKTLSFEEAAFLEPLSCVVHGMGRLDLNGPAPGGKDETALIFGAGPIGLLHLLLLRARGVRVAVCALESSRLKLSKQLGAEVFFKPEQAREGLSRFAPLGADYVIECTGRKEVWESAPEYARRGGKIMLFGGLKKGSPVVFSSDRIHYDELALMASFHFCPEDVKKAYRLLAGRKLDVSPLISGKYRLQEAEKAFKKLSLGKGIKYVIKDQK